jgi:hypothetical protein
MSGGISPATFNFASEVAINGTLPKFREGSGASEGRLGFDAISARLNAVAPIGGNFEAKMVGGLVSQRYDCVELLKLVDRDAFSPAAPAPASFATEMALNQAWQRFVTILRLLGRPEEAEGAAAFLVEVRSSLQALTLAQQIQLVTHRWGLMAGQFHAWRASMWGEVEHEPPRGASVRRGGRSGGDTSVVWKGCGSAVVARGGAASAAATAAAGAVAAAATAAAAGCGGAVGDRGGSGGLIGAACAGF